MLPKKLTAESRVHLVHTSSPLEKGDLRDYEVALKKLTAAYPLTKVFEVEHKDLDPRYLAASEDERLKMFRQAIRDADALWPIYGGTGCGDIIRHLTSRDLTAIAKARPSVIGFSDTTFLINYLYFKLGLTTFHYSNMSGLYDHPTDRSFLDILSGKSDQYELCDPQSRWLAAGAPAEPVEGIAIGGNLTVFRDLLDIGDIRPPSWRQYVLFLEDLDLDAEDFHRIIIALESRGIFKHIRALVVGRMDESDYASMSRKFDAIFGNSEAGLHHLIEYLLADVLRERQSSGDPLPILKVENFGHAVKGQCLMVPIGGRCILKPNACVEFPGPFVN